MFSAFDGRFAAWITVAVILIITPGPDTALIIRQALRSGTQAASRSALGIGAGSSVWALASVLGVAVLLESSTAAFTVLKFAGAAYLVYGLFSCCYRQPLRLVWVAAVGLVVLFLLFQITGHLLPWDSQAVSTAAIESGVDFEEGNAGR